MSKNHPPVRPRAIDHVYALSASTLNDFVKFVRRRTVDGCNHTDRELIDQWSAADEHLRRLGQSESGLADSIQISDLPNTMSELVSLTLQDRYFTHCYDSTPVAFAMVELDKLIITQEDVALDHANRIKQRLGQSNDDADLFRVCLPFDHDQTPARFIQNAGNSYIFESDSMDLRAYSAIALDSQLLGRLPADGPLAGAVVLPVGFGPNYLAGIRIGSRIILNNGYHRAHTLRAMGYHQVPMVIRVISSQAELDFNSGVGKSDALFDIAEMDRPPLLKDYFDPALSVVLSCKPTRRQVRVTVDVQVTRAPSG